jgi:hypothetical protein
MPTLSLPPKRIASRKKTASMSPVGTTNTTLEACPKHAYIFTHTLKFYEATYLFLVMLPLQTHSPTPCSSQVRLDTLTRYHQQMPFLVLSLRRTTSFLILQNLSILYITFSS